MFFYRFAALFGVFEFVLVNILFVAFETTYRPVVIIKYHDGDADIKIITDIAYRLSIDTDLDDLE